MLCEGNQRWSWLKSGVLWERNSCFSEEIRYYFRLRNERFHCINFDSIALFHRNDFFFRLDKLAGVLLLGTAGAIAPRKVEHMETDCRIEEPKVIHPFAFRTHTHELGTKQILTRTGQGWWRRRSHSVQWATKVMTPVSMYFLWKQRSWLLWPTVPLLFKVFTWLNFPLWVQLSRHTSPVLRSAWLGKRNAKE